MRQLRPTLASFFAVLAGALPLSVRAQTGTTPWTTQVWAADTLGSLNVNGLAQTPDGFLWVATPGSIFRFDGTRFAEFPPAEFAGEPGGRVAALCRSRDGGLWVAMDRGRLVHIRAGRTDVLRVGPPQESADDLLATPDGSVWIAYHGGIVCHVAAGNTSTFEIATTAPDASCQLACDSAGRVWLTQNGAIGVIENNRWHVRLDLHHAATRIAAASAGGLWVCDGVRLYRFGDQTALRDLGPVITDIRTVHPKVMREDASGALWIGTTDAGLLRYAATGYEAVPTSFRRINHLLLDNEGNLWVGTGGGGLDRIHRSAIVVEGSVTGLPTEAVQSLCETPDGTVWAATQSGQFVSRTNDTWAASTAPGTPRTGATCVAAQPDGSVWIGTRLQRLYRFRGGEFTSYTSAEGVESRVTNALCVTRNGDLWIAGTSPSSIQILRRGTLRTLPMPRSGLEPDRIAEDAAGTLWIGTSQGQLLRVTQDTVVEVASLAAPEPRRPISSLHATADGSVWIGYERSGLGRIKAGRFTMFRTEQGLETDDIRLITDDGQGSLWLGSARSIFKVSEAALDDVAAGRAARVQSVRGVGSTPAPGLLATRTESGNALRTHDGRLWFPMGAALAIVTPARAGEPKSPSPVRIMEVKVDERAWALDTAAMPAPSHGIRSLVRETQPLEVPSSHHKLEFDFACPSFTAPENVNFRYRLVGFDDAWIDAGAQHTAAYPRLPAGAYRFEVLGCNSAGIWSDTPAVLAFSVPPFWWRTWWFQLAVIVGFTLAVTAGVRALSYRRLHRRVKALERQTAIERERSRIARDIHDDVGNRLTRILMLSGLAQRTCAEPGTAEHLRAISASAMEVTDSLDEIVWAVNPRNDTLPHLIDYIARYAVEFLRTAGVRCLTELPEDPPAGSVPAEIRHNVFLALKEALNNVARHAAATEVKLRVALAGSELRASVEDNGRGFEAAPTDANADGLRNLRARMSEIGGRCEIDSLPGRGTRIVFTFPWTG